VEDVGFHTPQFNLYIARTAWGDDISHFQIRYVGLPEQNNRCDVKTGLRSTRLEQAVVTHKQQLRKDANVSIFAHPLRFNKKNSNLTIVCISHGFFMPF